MASWCHSLGGGTDNQPVRKVYHGCCFGEIGKYEGMLWHGRRSGGKAHLGPRERKRGEKVLLGGVDRNKGSLLGLWSAMTHLSHICFPQDAEDNNWIREKMKRLGLSHVALFMPEHRGPQCPSPSSLHSWRPQRVGVSVLL